MKITGTYKPPDSELDMDSLYSILLVSTSGTNEDADVTIATLQGLGHTAIQVSRDSFIASSFDTTGYDIVFVTSCADTDTKVFRTIYETCPNVLFGYFLESAARNTIYDLGIATSNAADSNARASYVVPLNILLLIQSLKIFQ